MRYQLGRMGLMAGVLTVLVNITALADTIPTITPFNVWVNGNYTPNGADVNGGLAVGGTATLSNYDIGVSLLGEGVSLFPSNSTFIAPNFTGETALETGNYYVGGSSYTLYSHGSGTADPTDPINFLAQYTQFMALSQTLSTLPTTGTDSCSNSYGTVTCTANVPNSLNVINLQASALGNGLDINGVSPTSPLIINVSGASGSLEPWGIQVDGSGSNGDSTTSNAHYVLFNFYNATSLQLGSGVVGSILAPGANVTTNAYGDLDGQLIANSYTATNGVMEFHNFTYDGSLPSVLATPEPGEYGVVALGLGFIAWARRRRLRG
jgi:choice-of-anchor A domain-containing protein